MKLLSLAAIFFFVILLSGCLSSGEESAEGNADAGLLYLSSEGLGSGNVIGYSDGEGIKFRCISDECVYSFGDRVQIDLIAEPSPDSSFEEWKGDCRGSKITCRISLDRENNIGRKLSAVFKKSNTTDNKNKTLTVEKIGSGKIDSDPEGISCRFENCNEAEFEFPKNKIVLLSVREWPNWTFEGWSGACNHTSKTCIVLMSEAKNVTALFRDRGADTYSLAVDTSGSGLGTVTSEPSGIECGNNCVASYPRDERVVLIATASPSSKFAGWSGACEGNGGDFIRCAIRMTQTRNIIAKFDPLGTPRYELTVSKSGTGAGLVTSSPPGIDCGSTCSAFYDTNQSVTLTAFATSGSNFEGWGGACSGNLNTCTVTLDEANNVTASFSRIDSPSYSLMVAKSGTGQGLVESNPTGISCGDSCSASYTSGANVTLIATEASGSYFEGWRGSCIGTSRECSLSMDSFQQVTAVFNYSDDSLISGRYSVLPDNTSVVHDITTGLEWQRCSVGQSWSGSTCLGDLNYYTWNEAMALEEAGGWRVPTLQELRTLRYCDGGSPTYWASGSEGCSGRFSRPTIIEEAFPNTPTSENYWTATKDNLDPDGKAFVLPFFGQSEIVFSKTNRLGVRLVRDVE